MTKPDTIVVLILSMIAWGVLIWGTAIVLVLLFPPEPEISFIKAVLRYFLLPLSVPVLILGLLRNTWLNSHAGMFKCASRGYLCLIFVVLVSLLTWLVASSTKWPIEDLSRVANHHPDYDPNDMIAGDELKAGWFYKLPDDIDRLQVIGRKPTFDPNAEEVYFEYYSPDLYKELDELLDFRSVNRALYGSYSSPPGVKICFYRGDELCRPVWHYWGGSFGNFMHSNGSLTYESKNRLHKWFERRGFYRFRAWRYIYRD